MLLQAYPFMRLFHPLLLLLLIVGVARVAGGRSVAIKDLEFESLKSDVARQILGMIPDPAGCSRENHPEGLVSVSHSGYDVQIHECDDIPTSVLKACALIGGPSDFTCQRDLLERLDAALLAGEQAYDGVYASPNNGSFYQRQRAGLSSTLAAMDATDQFNEEVASRPPFDFSTDFVSANWQVAFTVGSLRDQPVKLLEIGSFEGRSAFLWRRLFPHPDSRLVCIDLWNMTWPEDEAKAKFYRHTESLRASGFLAATLAGQPSSVSLMELAAHGVAAQLVPFDVVYVDGSHDAEAVLSDMVMTDAILRPGGYMLLDDFEWDGVQRAAHAFLTIRGECCYEVAHATRQLYLRKKHEHRPSHLRERGEAVIQGAAAVRGVGGIVGVGSGF